MVTEIPGTCLKLSRKYPGVQDRTEWDERVLRARDRLEDTRIYVSEIFGYVLEPFREEFRGHYGKGKLY